MAVTEPFLGVRTAEELKERPTDHFSNPELGLLAHFYRGEMYRSKVWRQRLDTTTNWAVVTTGVALSVAFSTVENTHMPILLITWLVFVFLVIEARRYRYFDIWRYRTRMLEVDLIAPILSPEHARYNPNWRHMLAEDLQYLHFHISFWEAIGRRLRRNYSYIFGVLAVSWVLKIMMHPTPVHTVDEFVARAAVGPLPGTVMVAGFLLFYGVLFLLGLVTMRLQKATGRVVGMERRLSTYTPEPRNLQPVEGRQR